MGDTQERDDLVERLRSALDDFERDIEDAYEVGERPDLWDEVVEVRVDDVKNLIERLSRERDTGVDQSAEISRLRSEKAAGEFWRGVFNEITDKTEREKIAAELSDFHFMMEQVPTVYLHITGGRMSKPNYYAADVIAEADSYSQDCFREDTDAEIEPLKAEISRLRSELEKAEQSAFEQAAKIADAEARLQGSSAHRAEIEWIAQSIRDLGKQKA